MNTSSADSAGGELPVGSDGGIEVLLNTANVAAAWKRVKSNNGAPGPDGVTVAEVDRQFETLWQPVAEAIRSGTYRPGGFRRVAVPKLGGERILRIPSVIDRVALQATAQVLEPIWEPVFHSRSYAYRKGRGPAQAVLAAAALMDKGCSDAVDLDIEAFFDNVDSETLQTALKTRVRCPELLDHLVRCIAAGATSGADGRQRGLPQGSPLSPLLANVAMHGFDTFLAAEGIEFVRYADDVLILAPDSSAAAIALDASRERLAASEKLSLNLLKTKTCPVEQVRFLGFAFRAGADGRHRPCISPEARAEFQQHVEEITEYRQDADFEHIAARLGEFVRGWLSYYGYGGTTALLPRDNLCGFARARLRGFLWLSWKDPATRLRMLVERGVPEEIARRDSRAHLATFEAARTPAMAAAFPNAWFARFGLADRLQFPNSEKKTAASDRQNVSSPTGNQQPSKSRNNLAGSIPCGFHLSLRLSPDGGLEVEMHHAGAVALPPQIRTLPTPVP